MSNEYLTATGFISAEDEAYTNYFEHNSEEYFDDNIDDFICDRTDEIIELLKTQPNLYQKLQDSFWVAREDHFHQNYLDDKYYGDSDI